MRLQTIATLHSIFLKQQYNRQSDLAFKPYGEQLATLTANSFDLPETVSAAMTTLGYETSYVCGNADLMQQRWAEENGVLPNNGSARLGIVEAQVKAFRPEVLLVYGLNPYPASFLRTLKGDCPSIRLVIGWRGAPYKDPEQLGGYDIVLSNIPELVQDIRSNGLCCYHVDHAFDPRILERIDTMRTPTSDFAFIGSINKGADQHADREKLLLELIKKSDLAIWSSIKQPTTKQRGGIWLRQAAFDSVQNLCNVGVPRNVLRSIPIIKETFNWERRPDFSMYVDRQIARRAHPPLFGLDMFQQLHDSKVALNTHINISAISASNMRLYEATGVGSCMLTDWKVNLPDLFEPEVEVVTYRDADECVEKVRYMLAHDDQRQAIAAAGQRRTLKDHTKLQRAQLIDEIIQAHIA